MDEHQAKDRSLAGNNKILDRMLVKSTIFACEVFSFYIFKGGSK